MSATGYRYGRAGGPQRTGYCDRLRDRAILAVLLGCGLRRSEVAAFTLTHVQQRDGRWCIVDLVGKHGRVRTIPMLTWVKVAIDARASAAGLADGRLFRPVNRGDRVQGKAMSEKVAWQMLQQYATDAGVPGIALLIVAGHARSSGEPRAASLSRSNCWSATPRSRRPSDI